MHTTTEKQTINVHAQGRHIVVDKALLFNNPANIAEKYDAIMNLLETDRHEGTAQLELLYKKHDDEPMIASHLATSYQRLGREEAANQMVKDNYRRFPLSIFARCDYAHLCIEEGRFVEAATAIEYTFDLAKLYPKKSHFHVLEIMEFQSLLVHYFCAIKDFTRAIASISFLRTINKELPGIDRLKTTIITAALQETLSVQNIEELFWSEEDDEKGEVGHAEETTL